MTVLAAGTKHRALVSVPAGEKIIRQCEARPAVTPGTSRGLQTARAAVKPGASLLSVTPVSLVTPVRAPDLSVTDLGSIQTPREVSTQEPAPLHLTGVSLCQALGLVRLVITVIPAVTHPASRERRVRGQMEVSLVSPLVKTLSRAAGKLVSTLRLRTTIADLGSLVISSVAVLLSVTLPAGRDTQTVRTPGRTGQGY